MTMKCDHCGKKDTEAFSGGALMFHNALVHEKCVKAWRTAKKKATPARK